MAILPRSRTTKTPAQLAAEKAGRFVSDPSQLPTAAPKPKQPQFQVDFRRLPGGGTQARRQTTEQAALPPVPTTTRGFAVGSQMGNTRPTNTVNPLGSRVFNTADIPAATDLTGSQFPFQLRRGISSDASRQSAFRLGFGGGEGRPSFARKSVDTFFDPRFMFNKDFANWRLQQILRRQHGA